MILLRDSTSLSKPMYMASIVWPTLTASTGCCVPDGNWLIQIALHHGHHHYQFLIDGRPTLDPKAQGVARNEQNEKVSLIAIS